MSFFLEFLPNMQNYAVIYGYSKLAHWDFQKLKNHPSVKEITVKSHNEIR
jgi:hypothetical protein